MNEILYFPKDKMICRIAGYTKAGNTSNVLEKIESLKRDAFKFANDSGVPIGDVCTHEVLRSRRYKNMSIFFATVPDEKGRTFYVIHQFTMVEWIEY